MPKVSQQYRDARREQILAAARRCFLRDGFHATSMQDLFAESGLSSGAVYGYFASKDDVILAIAEENLQTAVVMLHALATQRTNHSAGAALADLFAIVDAQQAENGLGAMALLVWAEALRNPVLADRFSELFRQLRGDLADIVREQQRASGRPDDLTADALATVLISMLPGYIVQLALLGSTAVEGMADAVRALWPEPQPA
jgi:AcrR family transcriptional regulator